jgi:hypothetical protein
MPAMVAEKEHMIDDDVKASLVVNSVRNFGIKPIV